MTKHYWQSAILTILLGGQIFGLGAVQGTESAKRTPCQTKDELSCAGGVITPDSRFLDELVTHYVNRIPLETAPPNLTVTAAEQLRDRFIEKLTPILGQSIGYKAGLTSTTAQKQFNVSHPLRGILLAQMLLPSGSIVPANFGARPLFEGDLIVRVGSEAINQATTRQEVLAALDAVIPFIELPDLIYESGVKLDAADLIAINVGARLGIVGEPILLAATPEWQERLGNIKLVIVDETGKELATGKSNVLLEHPLDVVLWLRDDLKSGGKRLKKGDLLSLGTITPLMPVESGKTIRAQYFGLTEQEAVEISVSFE
ncbi:2-keto-4-pentenoate hydratase [Coleofasciculus sp. G2-EDA-02]|uniref:2-keto-4-pentenoate hydratase n=1 Tax=Coleofasciculus sp. G2-EDA-02 TaxID=3069529 RepID=UPI0032FBFE03